MLAPMLMGCLALGCESGRADDPALGADDSAAQEIPDVTREDGASDGSGDGTLVRVLDGKLQGKLVGTTRTFLGIPYAMPPVGELRFAPPEPATSWRDVKPALEHGPSCPQPPGALSAPGPQSEDCLSLNVYAPAEARQRPLPVIVWIHGGAFVSGGSVQYDGARLSSEGQAVVVTLNYRLGALGFASLPSLDEERGEQPSGNDALRDQQLALRWVQRNIAAFGGDPSNVTVVGESAGSMSVCLQMVSPTARQLGTRFIMESGACVGGLPIGTKTAANALSSELTKSLCADAADPIACLREKPAAELVAWGADRGISGAGWGPIVDAQDPLLPKQPAELIASGDYNKGSFIVGSNKNEWGLFLALRPPSPPPTTLAGLEAAIDAQFGPIAAAVKAHYPATDATAAGVFVKLMTDSVFRCPSRRLARLATAQGSKVWLYSFEEGAAYHAYEIPYVFGNPSATLAPTLVEPLRATVQGYWTSFANSGDPNLDGQPSWPQYETASDSHMTLKAASEVGTGLATADCDFWDSLLAVAKL